MSRESLSWMASTSPAPLGFGFTAHGFWKCHLNDSFRLLSLGNSSTRFAYCNVVTRRPALRRLWWAPVTRPSICPVCVPKALSAFVFDFSITFDPSTH